MFSSNFLRAAPSPINDKKCLIVAAYHDGFEGQELKLKGVYDILKGKCRIKQFNMDTKRNPSPEFGQKKALEAKQLVESWKPDIIIAVDDNASKYFVEPYFKDSKIPVVFCGLDWTAEEYGYPYTNATGIIEVFPIVPLISQVKQILPHAKKAICIRGDRHSERKDYERYKEVYGRFGIEMVDVPVKTFDEFKAAILRGQRSDIILFQNYSGIKGFDKSKAQEFIYKNNTALIISQLNWMADYSILSVTQVVEEQGESAARIAVKILQGASPSDFPIMPNRKWDTFVNETLLEKPKLSIPARLSHRAKKVHFDKPDTALPKCLLVASYHEGYKWQDQIVNTCREILKGMCEILQFNMDTKRNQSPEFCREQARAASEIAKVWRPDVIIASDDNASKYFVAPYYSDSGPPVVFCGLNWSISEYGYPRKNTTGIIEVPAMATILRYIKATVPNSKSGTCLYASSVSEIKTANQAKSFFEGKGMTLQLEATDSMPEFESKFKSAQSSDFVLLLNNTIIPDWDRNKALKIVSENAEALTLTVNENAMGHTMLGVMSVAGEQGEYAAKSALEILSGTAPSDIPIVNNRIWDVHINTTLLDRAGIRVPAHIVQRSIKYQYDKSEH